MYIVLSYTYTFIHPYAPYVVYIVLSIHMVAYDMLFELFCPT